MRRYLLSGIFVSFFFISFVFGQNAGDDNQIQTCPSYELTLQGPSQIKVGVAANYSLQSSMPAAFMNTVEHEVRSGESLLATYNTVDFSFQASGVQNFLMKSIVRTDEGCLYSTEYTVSSFERLFVYLGTPSEEFLLVQRSYSMSGLLLHAIQIADTTMFNDEALFQLLVSEYFRVQHADVLIFDGTVLPGFLSVLPRFQQLLGVDYSDVQMFVLSQMNSSAFRRLFATYRDLAGINTLYVLQKQYVGSLLNTLVLGDVPTSLDFVKVFSTDLTAPHQWAFVSYFIDYLLYHNIPLSFLLLLMIVPVLVLLTAIFRQVVGFSVYGVFNPIFLAFSLHFLGVEPTIFFFVFAMLTVMLVNVFLKRVYLLYTSRIALLVVLYCFLLLCGLTIIEKYQLVFFSDQVFVNLFVLFPIIFILLVAYSIFKERTSFFRLDWIMGFLQFLFVSVLLYLIIRRERLQNILLGYPEVLLVVVIATILTGRFTGLQLTEYVRFFPLIQRILSDKDEEEEE